MDDCLVVGVPDERFGQRVVAIVGCSRSTPSEDELRAHVRDQLAHYKAPRRCIVVDHVQRAPNGKADYGWAARSSRGDAGGDELVAASMADLQGGQGTTRVLRGCLESVGS